MKIGIDASRIVNEKAGVGRFTADLTKAMLNLDRKNQYFLFCSFFNHQKAKKQTLAGYQRANSKISYLKIPGKVKEKIWASRLPIAKNIYRGFDVYLAPSFLEIVSNLEIPQVVIIYDLSMFKFPEHLGKKMASFFCRRTKFACEKARKIIAISENTKADLVKILGIPPKKIKVVYPGKTTFDRVSASLPNNLKRHKYILTVGTIEPRKNLIGLFKAYTLLLPDLQAEFPLVVAGGKGWNMEEASAVISQLKLENNVKLLGYVADQDLARLYRDAKLFVYPSLYEGFGFPVLEALSFGLPVVTSNTSALPEVVGSAGILVDPRNFQELSLKMEELLVNQVKAGKFSKQAKIQAEKFNWGRSARDVLKIIESLL